MKNASSPVRDQHERPDSTGLSPRRDLGTPEFEPRTSDSSAVRPTWSARSRSRRVGSRIYGVGNVEKNVPGGAQGPYRGLVWPSKGGMGPVWTRRGGALGDDKAEDQGPLASESMQKGLRGPGSGVNLTSKRLYRRLRRRRGLYRGS
jgi:hypothetical protein